jgi:hypothetical protein
MTAAPYHATHDGTRWCLYRSDAPILALNLGDTSLPPPQRDDDGWVLRLPAGARCELSLPSSAHWYGQGSFVRQGFPLDRLSLAPSPVETWDNGPAGHACIQEPLWLASNGLIVRSTAAGEHLRAGMNPGGQQIDGEWTSVFEAQGSKPAPALDPTARRLVLAADRPLEIRIELADDLPGAFHAASKTFGWPTDTPPIGLLEAPIWTTWARYKDVISQTQVLDFALEIREHGYPGATLEIDDRWQLAYGDAVFDPARFPDPRRLVDELRTLGFATTLWTTPFIAPDAACAAEAIARGFVLQGPDGAPLPIRWWRGDGWLLDVSNDAACDWWIAALKKLQQETGIAGYKFDAGEANFVPPDARMAVPISRNDYSRRWAALLAEHFPYGEARCGWHSQREPILFRQWDKFSTWGEDNGLASVVTGALNLGLIGYPFVLPDMIGGNAYGEPPSAELMIRWTQACAPMLAIQFSLPPWELGEVCNTLCRRYALLHTELAPRRLEATRQATRDGTPPIRAMVWAAPDEPEGHAIGDQYLLGDTLLVAPVLQEGQRVRDIWLPRGRWRTYGGDAVHTGGWLHDYPAPLDALPLFERID